MEAEMPHSEISSNYLNFKKKHTTNHNRKTKKFLYIFPEWQYYLYFVQKQKPKKNDLWEFWQYFITYLLVIHDDFAYSRRCISSHWFTIIDSAFSISLICFLFLDGSFLTKKSHKLINYQNAEIMYWCVKYAFHQKKIR